MDFGCINESASALGESAHNNKISKNLSSVDKLLSNDNRMEEATIGGSRNAVSSSG